MDPVAWGALVLAALGIGYTHVQTRTGSDSRKDEVRAQRSALIRVHRIRDDKGDRLIVTNAGQAPCSDAEVELAGVGPSAVAWIGVRSGHLVAAGLSVPAGSWISLPMTVGQGVDIMSARIEVRWSDAEGSHRAVQTLGSALHMDSVEPSLWAKAQSSGI